MRGVRAAAGVAALLSMNCNGGEPAVFPGAWNADSGASMAKLHANLVGVSGVPSAEVIVGVTRRGLAGLSLDGRSRWTSPLSVDARPRVAGDLVLASGEGRLSALDALTGQLRWSVSTGGRRLVGAAAGESVTIVTLSRRLAPGALITIDAGGNISKSIESSEELGRPAVLGNMLFVPWGRHNISAMSLHSWEEVARLRSRDLVSHAWVVGGALYFGEQELLQFDDRVATHSTRIRLPPKRLPGNPLWLGKGSSSEAPEAGAKDAVRVYARPDSGRGLADQSLLFVYQRLAMGLAASNGEARWVRVMKEPSVGGAAAKSGYVVCLPSGKVELLASNGAKRKTLEFGFPILSCQPSVQEYRVVEKASLGPLIAHIGLALRDNDPSLLPAQLYLIEELGAKDSSEVTRELLELASNPRTPQGLIPVLREQIAARRSGVDHLLAALRKHYDFLSDVLRPPPVGPIARALLALQEKRAGPLLAPHLNDPSSSVQDVALVAQALETLAGASEEEELRTFFALYRATATEPPMIRAVLSVAQALLNVAPEASHKLLQRAAMDPLTVDEVRFGLNTMLDLRDTQPASVYPP